MSSTEFESVCMDAHGGIVRTSSGAFEQMRAALDAAIAGAPAGCERVLVFEVETGTIVWEGSLATAALGAAMTRAGTD